jgi:hypothetical protein
MQVGVAGRKIVEEGGFTGDDLTTANRVLFMHTFGFVIHEASLLESYSPNTTPKLAFDHALGTLHREDIAALVEHLPRMLDFDADELFAYTLDRLLEGLQEAPERRAGKGSGA